MNGTRDSIRTNCLLRSHLRKVSVLRLSFAQLLCEGTAFLEKENAGFSETEFSKRSALSFGIWNSNEPPATFVFSLSRNRRPCCNKMNNDDNDDPLLGTVGPALARPLFSLFYKYAACTAPRSGTDSDSRRAGSTRRQRQQQQQRQREQFSAILMRFCRLLAGCTTNASWLRCSNVINFFF